MIMAKVIPSLLAALPFLSSAVDPAALLQQLEADHAALVAAEQDFHQRSDRGELGTRAEADYAAYLEQLRNRVAGDCRDVRELGIPVPAMPCAAFSDRSIPDPSASAAVPLNARQRTEMLDAELEAGLGEFDERLLREQERVRAAAPPSAAGEGASSGDGEGEGRGEDIPAGTAGGAVAEGPGDGEQAEAGPAGPPGAGAGGKVAAQGTHEPPPGTPDGSDDDVVARQLREAAEKEPDPVLRKKLWEEYRRYKEGIR
jgi:hypothetical protein